MARNTVMTGQVFGTVDWVTDDKRELGMFLRTSTSRQTRCVLHGQAVEKLIANNQVKKGNVVTCFGDIHARVVRRNGKSDAEVMFDAFKLDIEPPREQRTRGAVYANLKSVVMYWEAKTLQLKSFINSQEPGRAARVACSLFMQTWVEGMPNDSRQNFVTGLRVGREYTATANVETDCYVAQGLDVPVLRLLPTDFRLQD